MSLTSVENFLDTVKVHGLSKSINFTILGLGPAVPDYVAAELLPAPIGIGGVFYLKSGTVPGVSNTNADLPFRGMNAAYPNGGKTYTPKPYNLTFRVAEDFLGRNALEQWNFNTVNDLRGGGSSFPCKESFMDLGVLTSKQQISRIYRIYHIYPQSVSEITYNIAEANPQEVEFTAGFEYSYWRAIPVVDGRVLNGENGFIDAETNAIFNDYRSKIVEGNVAGC